MGNCCTSEPKASTVWFHEFEKTIPSLSGKRIAITGTTSGTGNTAAQVCLQKGAEVYLLNRPSKRAEDSFKQLKEACPGASVQQISCDLMDFASVREAARQLNVACQGHLDVLVNNAGIMLTPEKATKDGFDDQMQVNHLSHFLLTKEMLPALRVAAKNTGDARIVNHSSMVRKGKFLDARYFSNRGGKIGGSSLERYHQSKLANVVFTNALHDRLGDQNIKAVVCTPGFASTSLVGNNNPCLARMCSCMIACQSQSAEDGTMGLLTCISKPDVKSGEFYLPQTGGKEIKGPVVLNPFPEKEPECNDVESRKLLWELSEKAIGEPFVV